MTFRRSFIALTLVVAATFAAASTASAGARTQDMRHRMLHLVNGSRHAHGLRPLRLNSPVSSFAWRHSRRMGRRGSVYHSTGVWQQVRRYGASTWAENVGMAGTLPRLQRSFMASTTHRRNTLAPRFHRVGIGVVRAQGDVWVTLDFFGG